MLSKQSKILIIIATVVGVVAFVNFMKEHASWSPEPAADSYVEWVVVAVVVVVTGFSIALDTRKKR